MKDVTGKVAFITGGASGMGLAMARSFSAAGMKVAIADIEQSALDRVKAEFAKTNAQVITLKVDVTDRDAMERAAQQTEAAFGMIWAICAVRSASEPSAVSTIAEVSVSPCKSSGRLRPELKMFVVTTPGHSTDTPMLCGARSARIVSDMPTTAYFVVL